MSKDNSKPQYEGDQRPKIRKLIKEARSGNEDSIRELKVWLLTRMKRIPTNYLCAACEVIIDMRDDEVDKIIGSN